MKSGVCRQVSSGDVFWIDWIVHRAYILLLQVTLQSWVLASPEQPPAVLQPGSRVQDKCSEGVRAVCLPAWKLLRVTRCHQRTCRGQDCELSGLYVHSFFRKSDRHPGRCLSFSLSKQKAQNVACLTIMVFLPEMMVRQEGAIQGYIVSSMPAWATGTLVSKS